MRGRTCDYHGQSPKPFHYADNDYCWECDEKMVKALAAVERIRELHTKAITLCHTCYETYPCQTIEILDGVKA